MAVGAPNRDERPRRRVKPTRGEPVPIGPIQWRHQELPGRRVAMPEGRDDGRLGWRGRGSVVEFPGVLFQVEVATEAFAARGAREGFAILVCVHVERKVVDLVKRLRADLQRTAM